jgi:hypothetical protein
MSRRESAFLTRRFATPPRNADGKPSRKSNEGCARRISPVHDSHAALGRYLPGQQTGDHRARPTLANAEDGRGVDRVLYVTVNARMAAHHDLPPERVGNSWTVALPQAAEVKSQVDVTRKAKAAR